MKIDEISLNPYEMPFTVKDGKVNNKINENFVDFLKEAIKKVNDKVNHANDLTRKRAMGLEVDMAESIIASQEADMSFRLLLQIRNKLMTAHEELMRMQF